MSELDILIDGFEFDYWANRHWFRYLVEKKIGEPDRSIFQHIMGAQDIWYRRCLGQHPTEISKPDFSIDTLVAFNMEWKALLGGYEDDPIIPYKRFDGSEHRQKLSHIARHVIDHGTYHRGELRGLCRARDEVDFPETGLMAYYLNL